VLIDMHVHTSFGEDFETPLAEVIKTTRERGIDGVLLTECDLVPPLDEVRAVAEDQDFKVFVGIDVDCDDGRVIGIPRDPGADGFVNQEWADGDRLRVRDVVRWFADNDGATIAAHPYLDDGGPFLGDRVSRVGGLAGVEVACGYKDDLANDLALEASSSMSVPVLGGSDTGPEGQRLGRFATLFADAIQTQEDLVLALLDGTFWAVELADADTRRKPRGRGRGRRGGGRSRGNR